MEKKKKSKGNRINLPVMPGLAGGAKKRKEDVRRKQEVAAFYDVECPRDMPVDHKFVESMTFEEMRLDVDSLDEVREPGERAAPFYLYPPDQKEKFFQCIDDIGEKKDRMVENQNRAYIQTVKSEPPETIPILVPTGHSHPEMRLTKSVRERLHSILSSRDRAELVAMNDRECYNISSLHRFMEFENFIAPMLVMNELKKTTIGGKFSAMDEMVKKVIGTRANVVEFIPSSEHRLKGSSHIVTACYPMDYRSVFFLCLVMRIDRAPENLLKRSFIKIEDILLEEDRKSVLDMEVKYFRHFYFGCGCYNAIK